MSDRKDSPLPAGQVAAMMTEAKRRYNDNPDSAYGSAHAVLALCREIQRQAKVIEELENMQREPTCK